jgi:CheY-like chemotaxis protein
MASRAPISARAKPQNPGGRKRTRWIPAKPELAELLEEHGVPPTMSFQLAGMRAGAPTCDAEAMLRCLIVDDSPRFRDAARGLLQRQGITVVGVASNSAEALQRAEQLRPDVTLVDIDLGGESGLELAPRLHGQAGLDGAPVILVSTHAEQDYAELIAASPAIGFLPKTAVSAGAIRDLLAGHGDSGRAGGEEHQIGT